MASDSLPAFILASTLLSFAPGPDNLFVLAQSALYGRRAGVLITLGLCTGLVGHTLAVALGVAAIFRVNTLAFTALKTLGAAYLLYLAWQAFRASGAADTASTTRLSPRALYCRGIIMNLSNPKVALFFLAFLPQFADPDAGPMTGQLIALGGVFIGVALVVFSFIAGLAGLIAGRLRDSPRAMRAMNGLAGLVFVALALRLATGSQSP